MRHLPLAALLLSLSASAVVNESPVTLSWQLDGTNSRNRDYTYSFVIKNVSGTALADDWAIYYNAFSGNSLPLDKQGHIKMSRVFQGYYKLTPDKGFSLAPAPAVRCAASVMRPTERTSPSPATPLHVRAAST